MELEVCVVVRTRCGEPLALRKNKILLKPLWSAERGNMGCKALGWFIRIFFSTFFFSRVGGSEVRNRLLYAGQVRRITEYIH